MGTGIGIGIEAGIGIGEIIGTGTEQTTGETDLLTGEEGTSGTGTGKETGTASANENETGAMTGNEETHETVLHLPQPLQQHTPVVQNGGNGNGNGNGGVEEGEEMEDVQNDDDAAMMAMMGLTGFGSTKGKHVLGNQEGAANIKKVRTWRQYMNRKGGFNRPLDKIK
ncbi:hypothetical protein NMY22_g14924 [Coprinellus aureogranulatus]|nr:hypothetical protein NMY22_g14924 [Coprinellus aureogranulatus]